MERRLSKLTSRFSLGFRIPHAASSAPWSMTQSLHRQLGHLPLFEWCGSLTRDVH